MSKIRKCFRSRFEDGYIVEADFGQIEIICQAFLTNDFQMKKDILNGVDFHCKRLAYIEKRAYSEVWDECHKHKIPEMLVKRKKVKSFSFQRAYGAGATKIAKSLQLPVQEIQEFIKAEEEMYPKVVETQNEWIDAVRRSRVPTSKRSRKGVPIGKGLLQYEPTGRIYTFWEDDLPDWLSKLSKKPGYDVGFKITQIKNYPIQGFAGDLLHCALGSLYRELKKKENRQQALMINTVHDSVIFDVKKDSLYNISTKIKKIMENTGNRMNGIFPDLNFDLPLTVDIKYGPSWGEMSPLDLDKGD